MFFALQARRVLAVVSEVFSACRRSAAAILRDVQYPAGAWRRVQRAAAGRSRQFRAWLAEQRAEDLESTWTAVEEALAGPHSGASPH